MGVLPVCTPVHCVYTLCPRRPEECVTAPGTGVYRDICKLPLWMKPGFSGRGAGVLSHRAISPTPVFYDSVRIVPILIWCVRAINFSVLPDIFLGAQRNIFTLFSNLQFDAWLMVFTVYWLYQLFSSGQKFIIWQIGCIVRPAIVSVSQEENVLSSGSL